MLYYLLRMNCLEYRLLLLVGLDALSSFCLMRWRLGKPGWIIFPQDICMANVFNWSRLSPPWWMSASRWLVGHPVRGTCLQWRPCMLRFASQWCTTHGRNSLWWWTDWCVHGAGCRAGYCSCFLLLLRLDDRESTSGAVLAPQRTPVAWHLQIASSQLNEIWVNLCFVLISGTACFRFKLIKIVWMRV